MGKVNSSNDNSGARDGWDWPHIIPRKLLIVAFLIFNSATGAAVWVEYYTVAPGTAHWLILWRAAGANASGVWFWLVSGAFLYSEVLTMVLTMLSNRARMKAAIAEAVAEAVAVAVAEATATATAEATVQATLSQDRLWRDWNSRREAAAQEGREFTEPPPELPAGANAPGASSR